MGWGEYLGDTHTQRLEYPTTGQTYSREMSTHLLEGTWYQRYPRKDMGPEIPTPHVNKMVHTCETYLLTTSLAGGNDDVRHRNDRTQQKSTKMLNLRRIIQCSMILVTLKRE